MADGTKIEWTDDSWNPIRARGVAGKVGWHCEHVSEGCRNCYAEGINKRLGNGLEYKPGYRAALEIFIDEKTLLAPLCRKKSRIIFVCSMTDLFADFVTDEMIDRVFAVMALCPQHRFQVLTKRAKRMREYFISLCESEDHLERICDAAVAITSSPCAAHVEDITLPLPNVWLGVSAEDQARADERIPDLLDTPAAIHFVSLEPLLGPIDLTNLQGLAFDALYGVNERKQKIDWTIVGGESGPHARPMHPGWARSLRDQCQAAGVPFFFKQWGAWVSRQMGDYKPGDIALDIRGEAAGHVRSLGEMQHPAGMSRVGKRAAGRLLDGVEHNGMPT